MRVPGVFLQAEWRYLVMLNYAIDPSALKEFVPPNTELDFHNATTFVSVVGFQFLNTRVMGLAFPFHRNFEEVNLRFYVRRLTDRGWRRGVVFIRELVPRKIIAFLARACFGEPYSALPMRHKTECAEGKIFAEYGWRRNGAWESLSATGTGDPRLVEEGSLEEFITEHYWGYTARRGRCSEYAVEHPKWRVWKAQTAQFHANVVSLYGETFTESLSYSPSSAFVAEGSPVLVRNGSTVA